MYPDSSCGVVGVVPEYRHDLIRVEPAPTRWLDDDSGERLRYRGLLLLHREIRLIPLLSQVRYRVAAALRPMALLLAWPEAVELDSPCDVDHAGLVFAGGEVAGFLGGAGAGPVGAVPDEQPRLEDLEQEGGQCQVTLVRGGNPP